MSTINNAVKAYKTTETFLQGLYDKVPDKAQILTHGAGAVVGTAAGAIAVKEIGEKGYEYLKEIPDVAVKAWKEGNYNTAFFETAGRTMGAVMAGGVTVVVVGATVANVDAAVRSLMDKPARG